MIDNGLCPNCSDIKWHSGPCKPTSKPVLPPLSDDQLKVIDWVIEDDDMGICTINKERLLDLRNAYAALRGERK